ncbi:MAG TPA: hypothetical protein VMG10_20645 [Gemmataceae bacterium]|nr:hypothetical protein [Gemmataceae bacterium]
MSTAPAVQNSGLTPADWDQVHSQVQAALDVLAQRVRVRCPAAIVRPGGRTAGRVWFLSSYREFNLTEDDTEAEDVVAAMTFSPAADGIRILADIGGAATGLTDYEAPERFVPANLAAVLAAARELGEELGRQDEVVVNALSERRPPPDYHKERA